MKLKPLLFCHLVIAILLGTFFWPATRPFWDAIDLSVFKTLNGTLKHHHYLQVFWALINHQLTDWIEDLVFITFFVLAIRAAPRGERLRRTAQCLFLLLFAACVIFFVNRMLFRESFDIPRDSPTIVVPHATRISDEVFWLKIKDDSTSSFPGDHATTLLLFAGGYTLIAGWRLGRWAFLYALFRALPRLIAGAHWFTDIAVGSMSITLFFLGWAYLTPIHVWGTRAIETFLRLFTRRQPLKIK
ncbi:MAG: phosphatase PAP2 family protein [Verrucomicrobia bacterium]|nr:phosphatase PAP2 family protein [Verrucomicrobiota bacterium]